MTISNPRKKGQRKSLSCTECARRKLRCSKIIPCSACVDRGNADLCHRNDTAGNSSLEPSPISVLRSKRPRINHEDCYSSPATASADRYVEQFPHRHTNSPLRSASGTASPSDEIRPDNDLATDAPVALEFLALNRRRVLRSGLNHQINSTNDTTPSPEELDLILSAEQVSSLMEYHEANISWIHNVVHMPTFREQTRSVMASSPIPDRTWPALYYAMLSTTVYHMDPAVLATIDVREPANLAELTYQMSLDYLQNADFMAVHHVSSVQAICLLIYVGHNLGQSDRLSVLLASATRIAQCLGMHRLGKDGPHHTTGLDFDTTYQVLIDREVQKRAWWFLIRQDWLQIPYVNTYTLHPSQFNTPMPLICHDEKPAMLMDGRCIAEVDKHVYSQSSFTSVLNNVSVVIWKMQDRMCRLGHPQGTEDGLRKLYSEILKADAQLKKLMHDMPAFFREDSSNLDGLPQHVHHQRQVLSLTLAHKFYSIHRHFQVVSFKDPWYSYTRVSCLSIALHSIQAILSLPKDEYTYIALNMWTVNAQSITAVIWIIFELLFTIDDSNRLRPAVELRRIITQALQSLEDRKGKSQIARNGVRVIEFLSSINGNPYDPKRKFALEDVVEYMRNSEVGPENQEFEEMTDWEATRIGLEAWLPPGDPMLQGYPEVFSMAGTFDFDLESPAT